jgi:hypothetical protein
MAISASVSGQLNISDGLGTKSLARSYNLSATGTKYFAQVQSVGTAAETLAMGDCATLSTIGLVNPAGNTATVTVTTAAFVLRPGDVLVGRPVNLNITMQSTATATDIATAGVEV